MSSVLIEEYLDLSVAPNSDISFKKEEPYQITIGDIHGNAIKLLFMLLKHGIARNLTKLDYELLVSIYNTSPEMMQKSHIEFFNQKVAQIKYNFNGIIRLLGDELADRGSSDYFMLKLFQSLNEAKIKVEILISNHGVEFIHANENYKDYSVSMMRKDLVRSMLNLQFILDQKLVDANEIGRIVKHAYKPNLKIISYSLNRTKNEITIYSHAPIGLNTIKSLAKFFDITYQDSSAAKLALILEIINYKFKVHVRNNQLHKLYKREIMYQGYCGEPIDQNVYPIEFVMWNRIHDSSWIDRPYWKNDYRLNFVHGHDQSPLNYGNIYNLDNDFGKGSGPNQGLYTVLISQEVGLNIQELKMLAQLKILKKEVRSMPARGSVPAFASCLYAEMRQNVKQYLAKRITGTKLKESCAEMLCKIETRKADSKNNSNWGLRLFGRRNAKSDKQLDQLQKSVTNLTLTLALDNSASGSGYVL